MQDIHTKCADFQTATATESKYVFYFLKAWSKKLKNDSRERVVLQRKMFLINHFPSPSFNF